MALARSFCSSCSTKIGEPRALEDIRTELEGLVAKLQEELYEIRGETNVFERDLKTQVEQVSTEREAIARLRGDLSKIQGEYAATEQLLEISDIVEGRLLAAQQELTAEMQRLLGRSYRRPKTDATIGGIPVDSEYIIFIIDTSGSMHNYAWPLVQKKMQEVLNIYPKVKGIQVMNDMGQYMFRNYSGKWIPDTPGRRRIILDRLRGWAPFSNSSPVEGITRAIRAFASPNKKISLYVFGDEFTGQFDGIPSSTRWTASTRKTATAIDSCASLAIGFPVMFSRIGFQENTGVRFATLMRLLCRENGGAFVGLSTMRP